ncbi:MAG: hypothetical protein WA324_07430 [Bryobacteraceae bacterium]
MIDLVRSTFTHVAHPATYFLSRNIAAIQVEPYGRESSRLGVITQLPEGAELDPCGDGFDERTIKVKWQGSCYFVFLQDLEANRLRMVSTARSW